ncbi:MAG: glycosyltransferase [Candidatus Thiodiazotropha sp.]|jgi:glycosyltransferase involved in cell wall biosynthesis
MKEDANGAVLYDHLLVAGGAERVSLELSRHFSADLFIGFSDPGVVETLGFGDGLNITSLDLGAPFLPLQSYRLLRGFQRPGALPNHYQWLIYSGNFAPLAVRNHPQSRNILYCHAIPRFVYDLKTYYEQVGPWWRRPLLQSFAGLLKPQYEAAVNKMDLLIANSANVQSRIKHFLGRDSVVIHPPCPVEDKRWLGQEGYYLSLARLEPYKRVDRLISAFLRMPDKKLVVSSDGSDMQRLRALADGASNIHFTGWLSEQSLRKLSGYAIATLYIPIDEDFGMSPVESMAAGKPVIGVREGGLLETVATGETGILIEPDPDVEAIIEAVEYLTPDRAKEMREACEQRAQLFGKVCFFDKMERIVGE